MNRLYIQITGSFILSFLVAFLQAQNCADCRYISPVFDSLTIETVHFGTGVKANGDTQQLYMDIYQPYGDTLSNRPVVIFAFGGGFVQGGRNDWYVEEVCKHFTRAGYVSVSIDYRTGIDALEIIRLQHMRIFFRPMQDMRAAIQHLKWDYSENGDNFRIDTSMIFAGGASAGAITALMLNYCDKDSEMAEMGNLNALDDLGGFYSTSGFHQNYSWQNAATVNVAGALINADWVETGDVPLVAAHGNADQVVPYGYGPFGGGVLGGFFDLQGSFVVDSIARSKGVCSYLYTMDGKDHPSEDLGMEYIYSVVYRMMLRMDAIRNEKSFCCPLTAEITPGDTLLYGETPTTVTLDASLTNDNGAALLRWCSVPCEYISTATSLSVIPDTSLKYITLIANEGQCQSGEIHIILDSSDIVNPVSDMVAIEAMSVYPQPANDVVIISIQFSDNAPAQLNVSLHDFLGRLVYSSNFSVSNRSSTGTIHTGDLASGQYLLNLKSDNKHIAVRKLTVIH